MRRQRRCLFRAARLTGPLLCGSQAPTRKIYMLAGIQPSVELTGGPWFTDNELDTELVEQLKKIVHKRLQQLVGRRAPVSSQLPAPPAACS